MSSQFLLRMYLEKKDAQFKPALDRAIDFVVKAQFEGGVQGVFASNNGDIGKATTLVIGGAERRR